MAHKRCIFKNCTTVGSGEVTLFSFPKDQERQKKWLELAGRPAHTIQKADYLCELHFGPQYISTNQRRKILVGIAMPFRFDQVQDNENNDEQQIDLLEDRLDDDELQQMLEEEEEEDVDSHSTLTEHEAIEDYEAPFIICDNVETIQDNRKRKVVLPQSSSSVTNGSEQSNKLIKFDLNSIRCKPQNGLKLTTIQHQNDEIHPKQVSTTVIDHPDVSTFNIRGEEFIQMPKAVYLDEKERLGNNQRNCYEEEISKLRKELEQYKNIVHSIKSQLKSLP